MIKDKQIEKYRKETRNWKNKYLQLRREFLCCHEWEKVKTVFKKQCHGGGEIDILYRCINCNKEMMITKTIRRVNLEGL